MQPLSKIDIHSLNFDDILVDPYWNTGGDKENKMHKIHSYPAKFPAFITTKALNYAKNDGLSVYTVADVFCGCGTVAHETAKECKSFWGCDINPVATLIARVKSNKYDDNILSSYYEKIVECFNKSENFPINNNERISYWFRNEQIIDLSKLKFSILESVPKGKYRDFYLCAFSNILKSSSLWLTKSIKPQRDTCKIIHPVLSLFCKQFSTMQIANKENKIEINCDIKVETINFLQKDITDSFVDLVITSPPYVTSYEYADLHQLSTLWLDYVEDYKELRNGTIGSLYHNSNFDEDTKMLNYTAESIINKLCITNRQKAKSAAKYFVDMQYCVRKIFSLLKNEGMVLFVIGNTEYKNVRIDNARHLAESMFNAGFKDVQICKRNVSGKILTPYRDELGKFTKDKNSRQVYSEEFIIIGRKKYG